MASDTPTETPNMESDCPTPTTNDEGRLTVNLQIVSPSLSVGRPLHFPVIAASTTLKELKERIRSSLPLRPPDDHQRLIHRGRALVREADTLLQIFGEDAVHSREQQTMHLVVREQPHSQPTPAGNTATRGPGTHAPPAPATASQRPLPPHPNNIPQQPSGFPRRNPSQYETPQPMHAYHQQIQLQNQLQTQQQNMTSWINQVQRDAFSRALHRNRQAAAGTRPPDGMETHSGRASPVLGHYHREHLGPQGQTIQVETIIRGTHGTAHTPGGSALSPADVHNILRQADMSQATATMTSAMQRSASNASLHNRFMQPLTTPHPHALGDSRAGSGRATPDPTMRSTSGGNQSAGAGPTSAQGRTGYELYVLSSPEGPRALLVNNGNSDTYYTPRLPTQPSYQRLRHIATQDGPMSENFLQPRDPAQNVTPVADRQQQNQAQNLDPGAFGGNNENAQGENGAVAGLPPLLVQAWPHIWLAFRLGVFVWFFTSPTSTWSRWLSVIGLAVFIFVLSIGAFNNLVDLLWRPFAQQLENMLPRMEPQGQPRHEVVQGQPAGVEDRNPAPADMAARLIAQQRDRETWIQGQIRRIERASLLFLASIAPGVAERHIANLEAEARAERQRREAEAAEAAAREAEAQAANSEGNTEANPEAQPEQPNLDTQEGEERREENVANPDENPGGQPDLIAV